jgi:hypothetical protein
VGELIAVPCALAHETTVVLILSTARAQNPRKYGMKREVEIADARHLS